MGYAADRSGRAAGAASAGSAARRGADDRVLRARADARSRRSCAADGGPTGGRAPALRQLGARAGYRRAQDLTGRPSRSVRSLFEPQLAEQLVEVPTAGTLVPGNTLFNDRHGHEWVRVVGPTGVYFWNVIFQLHPVGAPGGIHRQPRAVYKYWATLTMLYKFQQSSPTLQWKLPQIRSSTECWTLQFLVSRLHARCCANDRAGSDSGENCCSAVAFL